MAKEVSLVIFPLRPTDMSEILPKALYYAKGLIYKLKVPNSVGKTRKEAGCQDR